jgi:hypothetical protein
MKRHYKSHGTHVQARQEAETALRNMLTHHNIEIPEGLPPSYLVMRSNQIASIPQASEATLHS